MYIDVIFTADGLLNTELKGKDTAVIDVFRATSVITTAMNNGAEYIKPFKTIEEALEFRKSTGGQALLGGERNKVKIEGFDFGNSPLEYKFVKGKPIGFTTTNGTQAIENAKGSENIYVLSFLNLSAACDIFMERSSALILACAGTAGKVTIDDTLCAGAAIEYILSNKKAELSDSAAISLEYYKSGKGDLRHLLKNCRHYNALMKEGYEKDVEYCLQRDMIPLVPYYKEGFILI